MQTKSCKQYRDMAWDTLSPHFNEVVFTMIIMLLIGALGGGISIIGSFLGLDALSLSGSGFSTVISVLLIAPLSYGFSMLLLDYVRDEKPADAALLASWKNAIENYTNIVVTYVLYLLILALIALPTLFIGSIILSLAYAMVPFILKDHPEYSAREALRASRHMMRGHKWELCVLTLSFIGWFLLCLITFGIAFLWVGPYMTTAYAHFYEDIKPQEETAAVEVETV